jgi:gliding motility-associated-like protein
MKIRFYIVIIILLICWSKDAFSQTDCVTDPPLPPVLTSISVQPETGKTVLTWSLSPSSDIAAYILYSYKNGDGTAIDTIWDPSASSYVLTSTSTKYFSMSYVIAAMRLPRCTSIFSNVLNTIFEEVAIDTCLQKIVVKWNGYASVPVKVTDYSLLMSIGGGSYTEAGKTDAQTTSFTLNNFTLNTDYCFVIRGNLENGAFSTSNKTCILTRMQRPPLWINADQATINSEGKVALSFTVDPLSEISHFSLERKTGLTGVTQEISQPVSANGSVYYIDNQANTDLVNYFRLSAINSCNLPVTVSNLASNLVLSLSMTDNNMILKWNKYKDWLGAVSEYKIFVDTGKGFEEKAAVSSSDSVFTMDYKQLMFEVAGTQVCFYVSATETSNPYGIQGESKSSEICSSPVEIITVPNVFTPNNDLDNDLFKPVLTFTPVDYHLIIRDRQGNVLFETRDYLKEWDGSKNGSPQPQGVYIWILKLTTPSGKTISRTGTITIINKK